MFKIIIKRKDKSEGPKEYPSKFKSKLEASEAKEKIIERDTIAGISLLYDYEIEEEKDI